MPDRTHLDAADFLLLHDGQCPLCAREIAVMQRLNRRERLLLEDITAPGFEAARYGTTQRQLMGHIHGVLPDGTLVTGMEALRRAYSALGLGWLVAPSNWPGLRLLFDGAYAFFARHRLQLTGRQHCDALCAPPEGPGRTQTHVDGRS